MAYNLVRFNAYRRCATAFVNGAVYDMHELANMLHDLRWIEVPRAFSVALYEAARKGPLRPGLRFEFKQLLSYLTFLAFGSTEREVVQPWFLKNWDDFFVSCVDGILSLNNRPDNVILRREAILRRAFGGVLTLVEGARRYMSLDRLTQSSAVHALLVAAGHARGTFLWHGYVELGGDDFDVPDVNKRDADRPMTLTHLILMDVIAEAILATGDTEVMTWERAFGHFAGSVKWRAFVQRCKTYRADLEAVQSRSVLLEHQVQQAYSRAYTVATSSQSAIARIHKSSELKVSKRERSAPPGGEAITAKMPRITVGAPPPPIVELEGTHGRPWPFEPSAALCCH
jgi:hypothetical protein